MISQQAKALMIINKCIQQNVKFRNLVQAKNFRQIHHSHYDWWAFPIDRPSSYGDKYQVPHKTDQSFTFYQNQKFLHALRSNAILVCHAWGYNLEAGQIIKERTEDQRWQNWPIRLFKMAVSLELFDQMQLFKNAIKYGCKLIDQGCKFHYSKDLSYYFKQSEQKYQFNFNQSKKILSQPKATQQNNKAKQSFMSVPKGAKQSKQLQHKITGKYITKK